MADTTVLPNKQVQTINSGTKQVVKKKDAEIFFDPVKQEFVVIHPSDLGNMQKDLDAFEAFKPYMAVFFPSGKVNQKDQAAEIGAVLAIMKEFVDAKNDAEVEKIIKELDKKIKEKKKEILEAGNVANGQKLKSGEIKEYLSMTSMKMVRIRSTKIKEHWRKYKFDTKHFNDDLEKEKQKEKKIELKEKEKEEKQGTSKGILKHIKRPEKETAAESELFEKKFLEKDGTFKSLINKNFFEDIDQIDAGVSSQFLRYSVESSAGSTIDWKNHNVKLSGKASGSASLIQGKGHFTVYLPDYDGFDLWATIRKVDQKLVKKDAKALFLQLKLNIEGSAFVGVCASVGLEVGVSIGQSGKKDTASAGMEGSLDLFAGAKASAQISISGLMKLADDKEVTQKAEWKELGSVTYGGYVAAGIGVTAGFKVGYWEGRFRFEAAIGVVLKLGAGTSIKGSIDPLKIGQFLYTVAISVDWVSLTDIFESKVYSLFQSIMLNCLYSELAIKDVVLKMYDHLPQIMSTGSEYVESGLSVFKSVDDSFDKYIPGYSGFKKHDAAFWLLKATYNEVKDLNKEQHIKDKAIYQAMTIDNGKRWQYATWQIKVNLISDMSIGMSLLSKYSDTVKQQTVIKVLKSARNSAEFKKITFSVSNIDSMLSGAQRTEFEQLKLKFR